MKNIFLLYMPPNNREAMLHYQETIKQRVHFGRVKPFLGSDLTPEVSLKPE